MKGTRHDSAAYVVLGAAGGVGSETARRLRRSGARVLLVGRASERLTALASELDSPSHVIDATSIDDVQSVFEAGAAEFGAVDGAVNCVGSLLLKPAHLTSEAEWDATVATNLRSAFATVRAAAKTMRRDGGAVILVSSAAARHGFANHEAIAAAKAGVLGLMLAASASYASYGLRFNAVAPGLVRTQLTESIWSRSASAKTSAEMHAAGRLGEPSDIASAICWLLDPSNSWITGEVISVDGGLTHVRPAVRRGPA